MPGENVTHSRQQIKDLFEATTDPSLKQAIQSLGDAISVGNVTNSTGVAIGRNIRMVVNQLNLPAETVAAILDVRNAKATSMGLDPDRFEESCKKQYIQPGQLTLHADRGTSISRWANTALSRYATIQPVT